MSSSRSTLFHARAFLFGMSLAGALILPDAALASALCPVGPPDCNGNGEEDTCEVASHQALVDCNADGQIDSCQIAENSSLDCDGNLILDECDIDVDSSLDCDLNDRIDWCEIAADGSLDCDGDGVLDSCQIAADGSLDCDGNGQIDSCEIQAGLSDCDGNGRIDSCDIADGIVGGGVIGYYFSDTTMSTFAGSRLDGPLDFYSDSCCTGPWSAHGALEDFSVRWVGFLQSPVTGPLDVSITSDDGVFCRVAGTVIADTFPDLQSATTFEGRIDNAVEGRLYPFTIEYQQSPGEASLRFAWDPDGDASFEPIPAEALFHGATDCDGNGEPDLCAIQAGAPDCDGNLLPDSCDLTSDCVSPDLGGTGDMLQCDFRHHYSDSLSIVDGLPPASTIEIDASLDLDPFGPPTPGGSFGPGGTILTAQGILPMELTGTGVFAGYGRPLLIPLPPPSVEIHRAPFAPGVPVQSFDTDMFRLQGQLPPGDPDFDLLRITAGSSFGLPSPGHTTLTQLPGGTWAVDSFFDITYRIDFVGAPGGPFGGMAGSTTGTIRVASDPFVARDCNANGVPDRCEDDCNGNGLADACDIANGTSLDCQPDGVPDECQLEIAYSDDSGQLYNFSYEANPSGVVHTLFDVPHAQTDVTLHFESESDLGDFDEYCELSINGLYYDDVLDYDFSDCDFKTDDLVIPVAVWNAARLTGGGDIVLGMLPTEDVDDFCNSYIRVTVEYTIDNDCNANSIPDDCDIADGTSTDCDANGVPDECQPDCDSDGTIDACEGAPDCNDNGIPDNCDIADGTSLDCDENGVPDECQPDCNNNGVADVCDIRDGTSEDLGLNGVPDECDPDCNGNGTPDDSDILNGTSLDCLPDGIPDECQLLVTYFRDSGELYEFSFENQPEGVEYVFENVPLAVSDVVIHLESESDLGSIDEYCTLTVGDAPFGEVLRGDDDEDCIHKSDDVTVPAAVWNAARATGGGDIRVLMLPTEDVDAFCEFSYIRVSVSIAYDNDCNDNGIPDQCDIADGTSIDCDLNGVPDECDPDCNANDIPDACDIADATSIDCDGDGVPDECGADCNDNGISDICDLVGDAACPNFPDAVAGIVALQPSISGLIPNRYDFEMDGPGGDLSTYIEDGGDDMYDDGNYLSTDHYSEIEYTDGAISTGGDEFGPGSSYFTLKQDGFFVLAARDISISYFEIDGNVGADGDGYVVDAILPFVDRGNQYTAFFKGVGGDGDPTINQIIVLPGDGTGVNHEFDPDSELDYHEVWGPGVEAASCLAYILAATDDDIVLTNSEVLALARRVLAALAYGTGSSQDVAGDGIPDECPITDCNGNDFDDTVEIARGLAEDCNLNGVPDECDIALGTSDDCDSNGVPDDCQPDCNANGVADVCDISSGTSQDCDLDGVPDECQNDCDNDGTIDACERAPDCNGNGIPDDCDIADGTSQDCNSNSVPDECDTAIGITIFQPSTGGFFVCTDAYSSYCFGGGGAVLDNFAVPSLVSFGELRFRGAFSSDNDPTGKSFTVNFYADASGLPGTLVRTLVSPSFSAATTGGTVDVYDEYELAFALSPPVTLAGGTYWVEFFENTVDPTQDFFVPFGSLDPTYGIPGGIVDYSSAPFDGVNFDTGTPEVAFTLVSIPGPVADSDGNGIPDECEGIQDCNGNGTDDIFDIATGTSQDCNANGVPDECDLSRGDSSDCNSNDIPDECELLGCIAPDEGGTADPVACGLRTTPGEPMSIVDGLPAGTTISVDSFFDIFTELSVGVPGSLGGPRRHLHGSLHATMEGTGDLSGYSRDLVVAGLTGDIDLEPLPPGGPVFSFDTTIFALQGQMTGDPDFDLLRVTAGSNFGLPSPGHTTLTQLPAGTWAVDSFFDITYRIDFVGAPGGPLAGMSGSTTGTIRVVTPGAVRDRDCDDDDVLDDCEIDSDRDGVPDDCDDCDSGPEGSCSGGPFTIATGADAGGLPLFRAFEGTDSPPSLVHDFLAASSSFRGGVRVAVGDVDGDGVPDMVSGTGPGGEPVVTALSGVDGSLLRSFVPFEEFSGGVFVAAGDVNGDGRADIVVGAGAGGGPHVKVFDGRTGSLLSSFFAYTPSFAGGVRVATGDIDGDGLADIVTGTGGGGSGGHVKVFDGSTGSEVRSFLAYDPSFTGGVFVAAGDLDGDGRADIVTGAGPGAGPHVKVFDGATSAESSSFFAFSPSFSGGVRVAVGDVDRDGQPDLLCAAGPGAPPHVKVFDGSSLSTEMHSFFAFGTGFTGGVFVAAPLPTRDCNGNGVEDAADIAAGTSLDCNDNGIPDECDVLASSACVAPDEGGTADILFCPHYATQEDALHIADGLPPGSSVEMPGAVFDLATSSVSSPSSLGGLRRDIAGSVLTLPMQGTGAFSTYARTVHLPVAAGAVDQAPHAPYAPLDTFDTTLFAMQGQLPPGDPDFDLLRITAGNNFGLPSPGHTTLTKRPSGDWRIDSFFDITYRIDFVGAPGGPFGGMSGSTTGTIRVATRGSLDCNGNSVPDECDIADGTSEDCNGNRRPDECDVVGSPDEASDNGAGSVNIPPVGLSYASQGPLHIIDGLPPATTVDIDGVLTATSTTVPSSVGPSSLGGDSSDFGATLDFDMTGTGSLAGFTRSLSIPLGPGGGATVVHTAPRTPGNPVQSFDTDMFRLFGQITGDPDFDLLRVVGGTDFGLPSPGHTTLTQLPGGTWAVDSFFDITYRIDFVGAPGGALAGMSGSTTGTVRIQLGIPAVSRDCDDDGVPDECEADYDGDGVIDDCDGCPLDGDKTEPGACGCGVADTDSDSDGTPDCNDECPNDPNKTEPGDCGCGVPETDSDSDGTPDCVDECPNDPNKTEPGDCGCGVPETDSDSDGTPDCVDECPNDPNKTEPGDCGCGTADTDSDSDGTPDCDDLCPDDPNKVDPGACGCGVADTDSDLDGTLDCLEDCPPGGGALSSVDGRVADDASGGNRDGFGFAVATCGDTAVIGAPNADPLGRSSAGRVYVYAYDGATTWMPQQVLTAPVPTAGDAFGHSVAISGDVIVVGAPYDDGLGSNAGALHVFRRGGSSKGVSTWTHEATLRGSLTTPSDKFGWDVAVSGDRIVAGSPFDQPTKRIGEAYVFDYVSGTWTQTARLAPSDGSSFDAFGTSVGIDGDLIAVGSPGDDDASSSSGAVYIYTWTGATWVEHKRLGTDTSAGDNLGTSVDVSGLVVAAGAPGEDDGATNAGAAYLFESISSSSSTQLARCKAPIGGLGAAMGSSVCVGPAPIAAKGVDPEWLVGAGAPTDDQFGTDAGAAHLFHVVGLSFVQVAKYSAAAPDSVDYNGQCVDLTGSTLLSGADWGNRLGSATWEPGTAYFFVPGP